jgi:putative nucleotidyltransferase with HDIG domain
MVRLSGVHAIDEVLTRVATAQSNGQRTSLNLAREFGLPFQVLEFPLLRLGTLMDPPLGLSWEALEQITTVVERKEPDVLWTDPQTCLVVVPIPSADGVRQVAVAKVSPRAEADKPSSSMEHLLTLDPQRATDVLRKWLRSYVRPGGFGVKKRTKKAADAVSRVNRVLDTVYSMCSLLNSSQLDQGNWSALLSSLLETLGVESLVWLPANRERPAMAVGAHLTNYEELREQVIHSVAPGQPQVWTPGRGDQRPPDGREEPKWLAVPSSSQSPKGWLVAMGTGYVLGGPKEATRLLRPVASVLGAAERTLTTKNEFKELLVSLVRALSSAIDLKDSYTHCHSERVAKLAVMLATAVGLDATDRSTAYLAGLLHDIGKIGVSEAVLKKPGPLTPEEYAHVMTHVELGVAILREVRWLHHLIPAVRHHHERYDGRGYPDGLKGEEIPLLGRILAVADAFDAMHSDRPYRPRRSFQEMQSILKAGAGVQWDPRLVDVVLSSWDRFVSVDRGATSESLRAAVEKVAPTRRGNGLSKD